MHCLINSCLHSFINPRQSEQFTVLTAKNCCQGIDSDVYKQFCPEPGENIVGEMDLQTAGGKDLMGVL